VIRRALPLALVAAATVLLCGRAAALPFSAGEAARRPPAMQGADVEEQLGRTVARDAELVGADGRPYRLGDLLAQDKPVLLALVYYECPQLCGLVLGGMVKAMRQSGLELGRDYLAAAVSFDPREGPELASSRQQRYLQAFGRPEAAPWFPFLTGGEAPVAAVLDSVGFRVKRDAEGQYAHVAALVVLTPEGVVSRYLYGIEYPPRDVRLALVEAAGGRVGTALDRVLLTCYRYDPASRRYEPFVKGFIRVGGLAVAFGLFGLLAVLWRRELRKPGRNLR
jgi:protein SCO1/2